MLKLLTSRLFWTLSPEKADQAVRSAARAGWSEKYRQGMPPDASSVDRNFHAAIDAGMQRLSNDGTREAPADSVERLRIHSFAAHYLPVPIYEIFLFRTMRSQNAHEMSAAISARSAVRGLRSFPNLDAVSDRPRPKPMPESVDIRQLRDEWRASAPLVTYESPSEQIARVFAGFSADDLHEMAHGEDVTDAPLIEAIARHPLCDWGSASEILHSFSASEYQRAWRDGAPESSFGDNDRILFRAFSTIADRARCGDFRTRRFQHNWNVGKPFRNDGSPNEFHPVHWVKWHIAESALRPTKGERHYPSISFDGGRVLPDFERWKRDREHP